MVGKVLLLLHKTFVFPFLTDFWGIRKKIEYEGGRRARVVGGEKRA